MSRRVVGPLHVLGDEHDRGVVQLLDHLQHHVGSPVGSGLGGDRVGLASRRDRQLQRVAQERQERLQMRSRVLHPALQLHCKVSGISAAQSEQRTQRIADHAIAVAGAVRLGVHVDEAGVLRSECLTQQPRLAESGRTDEGHHPAATARDLLDVGAQRRQFPFPADEREVVTLDRLTRSEFLADPVNDLRAAPCP
jgi:hypothetical protein